MNERNKLPDVIDAFAACMRVRRAQAQLSQEELAHRAGLSMSFVSLLETGKRQPTISTLAAICRELDVPMTDFVADMETRLNS